MSALRRPILLLLPGGLVFFLLFVLPMAGLFVESLKFFTPGTIGSSADAPWTLANYGEMISASFAGFLWETIRISLVASLAGIALGLPLAYWMVRSLSTAGRSAMIGMLVTLIFLSILVRAYALELTFDLSGILRPILLLLQISPNGHGFIATLVTMGLLHYIIPMAALTLLAAVQNVNPALIDAAQSLGAPAWKAHATITLPLCARGLTAAFLFAFTFSISAFVIPMILGKGRVLFISNLIYNRFSETANYPSGAAISIVLLGLAFAMLYLVSAQASRRFGA